MKLMCIDDSPLIILEPGRLPPVALEFGKEYHSYADTVWQGDLFYMLDEIPGRWYIAKRFVPLSGKDTPSLSTKTVYNE